MCAGGMGMDESKEASLLVVGWIGGSIGKRPSPCKERIGKGKELSVAEMSVDSGCGGLEGNLCSYEKTCLEVQIAFEILSNKT